MPKYQNAAMSAMMEPALSLARKEKPYQPPPRPRPKPGTPDLIMSIPPELRNSIYDYVLDYDFEIHINAKSIRYKGKHPRYNGILRVSKQIRQEAHGVYLSSNTFIYHINPFSEAQFLRAVQWLRPKLELCGAQALRDVRFKITGGKVWSDLESITPLLQLVRNPGFLPKPSMKGVAKVRSAGAVSSAGATEAQSRSIFELSNRSHGRAAKAREAIVLLAKEAHGKDMSQEEFESLVKGSMKEQCKTAGRPFKRVDSSKAQ